MTRTVRLLTAGVCLAVCFGVAGPLQAQTAVGDNVQPRFAVSAGVEWLGSVDAGGLNAQETPNGAGSGTLFSTHSEVEGGVGGSASLAVRLAGVLWAEASFRYHPATLTTDVSGDVEGANGTASESLEQFLVEGGALLMPPSWHLGPHVQLYASGGAGYLRQLHHGETLAETGQSFYAGAGAILWLPQREGRAFRSVGLRIDPRVVLLRRGVAFDDRVHAGPAVAASLFLRF